MVKSVLEHSREARRLWWWCDRTGRWALEAVVSFGRTNCRSVGRPPHSAVFCGSGRECFGWGGGVAGNAAAALPSSIIDAKGMMKSFAPKELFTVRL